MFRRTALLTICVGFVAAVAAGGVSAKDGFKMTVTLDPIPPLTQTALLLNCEFTRRGWHERVHRLSQRRTEPESAEGHEVDQDDRGAEQGQSDGVS